MKNDAFLTDEQVEAENIKEAITDDYDGNMPCDTYGPAACTTRCSNYYKCHK